jgi:hypothetical protein
MELADPVDRRPYPVRDRRPRSFGGVGGAAGAVAVAERGGEVLDDGVQLHLVPVGLLEVAVRLGVADVLLYVADLLLILPSSRRVDRLANGRLLDACLGEVEAVDFRTVRL